jgi:hypothetical protein
MAATESPQRSFTLFAARLCHDRRPFSAVAAGERKTDRRSRREENITCGAVYYNCLRRTGRERKDAPSGGTLHRDERDERDEPDERENGP